MGFCLPVRTSYEAIHEFAKMFGKEIRPKAGRILAGARRIAKGNADGTCQLILVFGINRPSKTTIAQSIQATISIPTDHVETRRKGFDENNSESFAGTWHHENV